MTERRVKISGQEFLEYDASDLRNLGGSFEHMDGRILLPYSAPDDFLIFAGVSEVSDLYFYISRGISKHQVERGDVKNIGVHEMQGKGFSATQLNVFREDDWYGECFQVLNAHGWLEGGGELSGTIIDRVSGVDGACSITKAKIRFGAEWTCYIGERAALHFSEPLSRLWYAANMLSLYYAHHDDLRLGFLWAEYQVKKYHEIDALRGQKNVASARSGGLQRAREQEASIRATLQEMRRMRDAGHSVSNAARLAYSNGFGSSPEANRKLWTRHNAK